jgi:hypothetical protein
MPDFNFAELINIMRKDKSDETQRIPEGFDSHWCGGVFEARAGFGRQQ